MTDLRRAGRALISVSDKTGLVGLGQALAARGIEILSTGGSAAALRSAGVPVRDVADFTGFPEMLDGRVKTLHPKIHGGILQRREDPAHQAQAAAHGLAPIDIVVVNLYPFRQTVEAGASLAACIENIDIGGPAMVRSAAKNHDDVAVLTDPAQYDGLIAELVAQDGMTTLAFRRALAAAAFAHTAAYDAAVSEWFARQAGHDYPDALTLSFRRREILRYGENPHQSAAFYVDDGPRPGVATAIQAQGKALSYNNINDTDAAFELVCALTDAPAVAIIKHANPCGVAQGSTLAQAYERALACDPVSAFGGIIACNRPLDGAVAEAIARLFSEVIIAPDMDDAARDILAQKKNLRVLLTRALADPLAPGRAVKSVAGGLLVQSRDAISLAPGDLRCVTRRAPTPAEERDALFAFTVAKHVKSNAIVYAKDLATVGIGAGQMSRVDSARIAARKAEDAGKALGLSQPLTQGSAAASDAFFPFADGLDAISAAGATCVIQPGGSVRDAEVIEAADKAGLAMLMTGVRHFYH